MIKKQHIVLEATTKVCDQGVPNDPESAEHFADDDSAQVDCMHSQSAACFSL